MKDRKITIRVTEEMAQQIEAARSILDAKRRLATGRAHKRNGMPSAAAVVNEALTRYFRRWAKNGN